jgi:hypothetical protein
MSFGETSMKTMGLLLLTLLATPLLTLAQEDDEILEVDTSEWVEFTTEDEVYTLLHPPDWFVDLGEGLASIVITSNESLLELLNDPAVSGDKVIIVYAFSREDFHGYFEIELREDATTEDLLESMYAILVRDAAGDVEIGETEVLEMGDDLEFGIIEVISEAQELEGYFFLYEVADDVLMFGSAFTYSGELDEEIEATFLAIFENLQFNITAKELTELMGD